MRFGLCYIPDYHPELSGSWQDWYDNMIREVQLAEALASTALGSLNIASLASPLVPPLYSLLPARARPNVSGLVVRSACCR